MAAWTKTALKDLIHETIGESPVISVLRDEQVAMRQEQVAMRKDQITMRGDQIIMTQKITELGASFEAMRGEIRAGFANSSTAAVKKARLDTHESTLKDHQDDIATLNSTVKHHITNKKIHLPE